MWGQQPDANGRIGGGIGARGARADHALPCRAIGLAAVPVLPTGRAEKSLSGGMSWEAGACLRALPKRANPMPRLCFALEASVPSLYPSPSL